MKNGVRKQRNVMKGRKGNARLNAWIVGISAHHPARHAVHLRNPHTLSLARSNDGRYTDGEPSRRTTSERRAKRPTSLPQPRHRSTRPRQAQQRCRLPRRLDLFGWIHEHCVGAD
ncbi:hypothetical protein G7K_5490-t1 [Saitoella complicata NRRL Y-17804]|uniref:Uncharacterized protein n=1 Tax=Saitoella complicata (strain BCRC 22490 / CBS 7301 / JCM 7358 / NBRC 10748 / NRRL Y-17804) TaxID=698492 RepID=A0A0E9NNL6_SAICN|nr:hypothetical protein G7K_5490-t1 [Saitoella complicata NRRL Y-17804]